MVASDGELARGGPKFSCHAANPTLPPPAGGGSKKKETLQLGGQPEVIKFTPSPSRPRGKAEPLRPASQPVPTWGRKAATPPLVLCRKHMFLVRAGERRHICESGPSQMFAAIQLEHQVPLVLLIGLGIGLTSLPAVTAVSRRWERAADCYSLELTGDRARLQDRLPPTRPDESHGARSAAPPLPTPVHPPDTARAPRGRGLARRVQPSRRSGSPFDSRSSMTPCRHDTEHPPRSGCASTHASSHCGSSRNAGNSSAKCQNSEGQSRPQ
jgi:hypothetical protein